MLNFSLKTKLTFILALALLLRLVGISLRPIWYDEAFSILLAEQGPAVILSGTLAPDADSSTAEEHPPAYYFTLWGWIQLYGNSLIGRSQRLSTLPTTLTRQKCKR